MGSYGIEVPVAMFWSISPAAVGLWWIFVARALAEVLKTIFYLMRYRTPAWYKKSVDELRPGAAK